MELWGEFGVCGAAEMHDSDKKKVWRKVMEKEMRRQGHWEEATRLTLGMGQGKGV